MSRHFILAFALIILLGQLSCGERHYQPEESDKSATQIEDFSGKERRKTSEPDIRKKPVPSDVEQQKASKESKTVADFYAELKGGVFEVHAYFNEEEFSQGSGFFIAEDIGITNFHVLEGTERGFIIVGNEYHPIEQILDYSVSEEMDYVIFRTSYRSNHVLPISSKLPRTGEEVFAIGSPKRLTNSLTKGIISGWRGQNRIQIDATIDHGSSGGPLFDMTGKVIGITSSGLGTGSDLNFAINIQALPYKTYISD